MSTATEKLQTAYDRSIKEYSASKVKREQQAALEKSERERLLNEIDRQEARIVELFENADWSKAGLWTEVISKWGVNWPATRAEIPTGSDHFDTRSLAFGASTNQTSGTSVMCSLIGVAAAITTVTIKLWCRQTAALCCVSSITVSVGVSVILQIAITAS